MPHTFESAYSKPCANCGRPFMPRRPDASFGDAKCQTDFHNRQAKRGKVLMPLLLASAAARHSTDERMKEAGAFGRREAYQLLDRWNTEDKAQGRPPAGEYVTRKMANGWRAADLALETWNSVHQEIREAG